MNTIIIMKNQKIGYIRVSSHTQNTARQLDGVELDKTFMDSVSGKDKERPQFQAMLEYAREGDTIHVHSMDRLARNTADLINTVRTLTGQGISVCFTKENLTFTGDDSPMSKLMLAVMGGVCEFEREIILERQREGVALAKARGVYKGRKRALSEEQEKAIALEYTEKKTNIAQLARDYNVSRNTIYKALRSYLVKI